METTLDRERRLQNQLRPADEIVAELRSTLPAVLPCTAKVGAWLWIQFPARPDSATLAAVKQLGFSWNRDRCAWQNPCGVFRRRSRTHDPRDLYGEEPVTA